MPVAIAILRDAIGYSERQQIKLLAIALAFLFLSKLAPFAPIQFAFKLASAAYFALFLVRHFARLYRLVLVRRALDNIER